MSDRPDETELPHDLQAALQHASERGSEPGRDLWPAIEVQLRPRAARRRFAIAASILLALLLGLSWRLVQSSTGAVPSDELAAVASSDTELFEALTRHRAESERLLRLVDQALASHPQQVGSEVRNSLDAMQAALAKLELALVEEPGAPQLASRLAGLYEQHLRVLEGLDGRLQGRGSLPRSDP
ncbi:MAG: hypothetical protein AAF690_28690 [Acidobacteriota bacterium]